MQKIKMIILIVMLGNVYSSTAQEEENFKFTVDINRFRYSDSLTYLEFSASVYRNLLTYIPEQEAFRADFIVTASLSQGDSVVAEKKWNNVNTADSLTAINERQQLYCMNNLVIKSGEYDFSITMEDGHSDGSATYSVPLTIEDYTSGRLTVSDIQLASSINRDTTRSPFTKNGFRVFPNPSALYGIGLPILYCYSEVYHLAPASSDSGGLYQVTYSIMDNDGNFVKTLPSKKRSKPGNSSVEVNGINVVTLVSGQYVLNLEIKDIENGDVATSQRKFFVYREADFAEGGAVFQRREQVEGPGSAGLDADRYDIMTEKELDEEFGYTRYISTKDERNTYKKLNLDGKREYIKEFWARRDQTPGTPANEYKRNYFNLIELANNSYKGTFREGWRTDRGRVLLVYGRPDEIERFPFSSDNKAYEVWNFFGIQGGVVFIFVDRREMGDYELVHSTARGELYDPDWTRWIDPNR